MPAIINDEQRADFLKKQAEEFQRQTSGRFGSDAEMFMPTNGSCFHCKFDIIPRLIEIGNDGSELVTGCPYCGRTYCD